MAIDTDGSCSVYIIYRDSRQNLYVLFPAADTVATAAGFFRPLPESSRLDQHRGLETFHVIASTGRLEQVEVCVRRFQQSPGEESGRALLAAIQKTRESYEELSLPVPKPVLIAGRIRADIPVLEYRFEDVLCRTFTLEHD